MAESFDLTDHHRAVVRSWHGGDTEEGVLFLHRQSPALIARFFANAQMPWFIQWCRMHPFSNGFHRDPSPKSKHLRAVPPAGYGLTTCLLGTFDTRYNRICGTSKAERVRVHLLNGTQIGLVGVGEGDELLTFPSHYLVGEALRSPHWIRKAEPSDKTNKWYVILDPDRAPKAIVHKDGTTALPGELIGMKGEWATALVQPSTQPPIPSVECLDISDVKTPTTPGSASDDSERCVR